MGGSDSKAAPQYLSDVLKYAKYYSMEELQEWYDNFLQKYPNGYLTETQFMNLYISFYPTGDAAEFSEHIFRNFDLTQEGQISFKELMLGLSVRSRGSIATKLKWIFSLFDINNNGRITKTEMIRIMKSMYKSYNIDDKMALEHVDRLYRKLDKDADGELTLEEFMKLGNTDPNLTDMVCGYGIRN